MADVQSGETIRNLISGFNTMQAQLGLLPTQTGGQPMGVSLPAPPPPPPVMHPSEAAFQAVQQHQQAMQSTVQAAQMTRYVPPPSSPPMGGGGMAVSGGASGGMDFTWGRSMNQMASQQLNPFVANAFSGGGGMGMPHPMMMTSPQYGGYRPRPEMTNPFLNPGRIPDPMNPFAVQLPQSEFAPKYLQDYRVMQGQQAAWAGYGAGKIQGGLGAGGALLGGVLGSAFGPLGTMAGSWLGGKAGNALGGMFLGPAVADEQRGRQIQNMTASYMVGGPNLNPFTGQGMERGAARDTAYGLRHLVRDHDFERQTGFNTADVMKITQLASDQGLLQTARSPDDITRKVKDISKAVKTLVQITGDPDVRNAIASLGQMRELGFEGLGGQTGAVANRAAFARMAGVSQAAMVQQYGAPGAMMAQQIGMAGATGFNAGMMGGASANMAVGAGAFTDLQLARAGGRSGLAQTNMMAALGAANPDLYMAAALRRDSGGKLNIDVEAYKRAQSLSVGDVANMERDNIQRVGQQGIYELATRKQEFKDMLAQRMGPMGMQMNVVRQAQGLMSQVPGMTFGAALRVKIGSTEMGQGMSAEQQESAARALELQFENKDYWDTQVQQMQVQKRQAGDRERARWARYRTPGQVTRVGYAIRDTLGDISDAVSSPFASLAEHLNRAQETRSLQSRGEYMLRNDSQALIRTGQDRKLFEAAWQDPRTQQMLAGGTSDVFRSTGGGGWGGALIGAGIGTAAGGPLGTLGGAIAGGMGNDNWNRLGTMFGTTAYSARNQVKAIANEARGSLMGIGSSFGDIDEARALMAKVHRAASAIDTGMNMTGAQAVGASIKLGEQAARSGAQGSNATTMMNSAALALGKILPVAHTEGGWDVAAGAAMDEMFKKAFVQANTVRFGSAEKASAFFDANSYNLMAGMSRSLMSTGTRKEKETLMKALETDAKMRGVQAVDLTNYKKAVTDTEASLGLSEGASKWNMNVHDRAQATVAKAYGRFVTEKGRRTAEDVIAANLSLTKNKAGKWDVSAEDEKFMSYVALSAAAKGGDPGAEARLAKLTDEAGPKVAAEWEKRAEGVREALGDEGRAALASMAYTSRVNKTDLGAAMGSVAVDVVGRRKVGGGQEAFIQKLKEATGKDFAEGGTLAEKISKAGLTEADVNKITNTTVRNAVMAQIRGKGSQEALGNALEEWAPPSEKAITGGPGGEEVANIDKTIEEMKGMKEKVGKDKPVEQLQADSAMLLATSAKHLDDVADKLSLIIAGPGYQSGTGGQ